MDQVKRKLSSDATSEENTKKLRNEFGGSITCIENLSNEFFYEIFDYLDGCEIYEAFSNLNHRFQQLLNSSYLLFKIKFDHSISNETLLILINKNQIFSIDLWLPLQRNHFFSSIIINSSLNRLESFSVEGIKPDILISLLINLACLPRLFSLSVNFWNTLENLNDIYRLIFALPTLKYNRLYVCNLIGPVSLPMAANKQVSTIEYLVINHFCTSNELSLIISYTPQLRRLNLLHMDESEPSIRPILPITLSNLTEIDIYVRFITFNELEIFIKKICSKLKVLCVIITHRDIAYLNAHRWEQLILQYLPQLERFCLQYDEHFYTEDGYPIYSGGPNQFSSSFWIERQWAFQAEITADCIKYSIRPYRKRWYEYAPDNIVNSSVELSKSTQLTLTHISSNEHDEVVPRDIIRVLTVTQIHQLEIRKKEIFIGILIQIINLLPELNLLKIHSLSLDQPRELCEEEIDILCSIEDTSKITKVYLETMVEIEEFYFLMLLCPYMTYLKVEYLNNMNVELFVRDILKKINFERNQYLRLLCFHVPAADDEVIKKFKKMINAEKFSIDYTITRILDNIYLQWRLL